MTYQDFLETKLVTVSECGFEWAEERLPEKLFPWQKEIVLWALKCGRAALFEDCGLGKTPQQLAWAQAVSEHEGQPVLILAPLAVSEQTKREGMKFGVPVTVCRTQADVRDGVNITNYEMMRHFDASAFCGVVLDESSILKDDLFVGLESGGISKKYQIQRGKRVLVPFCIAEQIREMENQDQRTAAMIEGLEDQLTQREKELGLTK